MTDAASHPLRFFISYRRRAEADARLATHLVTALGSAGCEVFIDVQMPVGIDWSNEIARRVEWCDYMVVLLSAESDASEMVRAEARRAHEASKARGRAKLLPVRVNFTGALNYELDGYLGKLQYVLWRGEQDNAFVAQEILRAARTTGEFDAGPMPGAIGPIASGATDRPEPKADMRLLREAVDAPGSALDSDNPFYIRRAADERIEEGARGRSRTLVIKAPSQSGKSSLLLRYLAQCHAAGKKLAFVDLTMFGDVRSLSFSEFAQIFIESMLRELAIHGVECPVFKRGLELTNFMHDEVLPRIDVPFVIALDDADRILGADWQVDFYSTLRIWDANRTNPNNKARWGKVGLALVIATEPTMLIEKGYQSPFNVTPPITLPWFKREGLTVLNASYKQMLTSAQLDALFELLQGHPYLTPLAFYRLLQEEYRFDELVARAARDDGPFGDHLRSRLDRLHNAKLTDAMREVVLNGVVPGGDRRLFYRLEAAGLVRESDERIVAANAIYDQFFRAVL